MNIWKALQEIHRMKARSEEASQNAEQEKKTQQNRRYGIVVGNYKE